ncbi:hypothetical protein BTUL_0142g00130 [Botrytis tulipae]|uniref:Major facilitator superfamily (MFS) profile domain-containing protein n=1 Tax=Botrytis tulipae TaxID=87230 RepID=A0A4Z1ED26_9HELO|nr:hypothetical protein BTUL_0142g00130 [Botrytis tulipae]
MHNSKKNWNESPAPSRERSKAAAADEQVITAVCDLEKTEPITVIENDASPQEKIYPSGWKSLLITLGIMAAVLVVALDNYFISALIFLTIIAFQPAHGQIFTLFSVKWAFLISILWFEVGSIISAAAPNSIAFIFGRLICGAAAGGIWCEHLRSLLMSFLLQSVIYTCR